MFWSPVGAAEPPELAGFGRTQDRPGTATRQNLPDLPDLPDPRDLPDLPDPRDLPDLPDPRDFGDLPDPPDLPDLSDPRDFGDLPDPPDLLDPTGPIGAEFPTGVISPHRSLSCVGGEVAPGAPGETLNRCVRCCLASHLNHCATG